MIDGKEIRPILALTMGDPAGIGPEINVKAMMEKGIHETARFILIGNAGIMEKEARKAGDDLNIRAVREVREARFERGVLDVLDLPFAPGSRVVPGVLSAEAGDIAFRVVKKAIGLALAGEVDACVTAPINKEALNRAGHHFAGHTEIFAHFTGTDKVAMLLAEGNFRVIHVSTHVSLRQACDLVRKERILEVIRLMHEALGRMGLDDPFIGVAGLNPHSGDGGLFGDEETREIIPALEAARSEGMNVEGPVPPDSLFALARGGHYDGCVAMYHDQGHIPFKFMGFEWDEGNGKMKSVRGVNISLGLPIIRTSVDHGTAFGIAGKGIASPEAMLNAIEYAVRMHSPKAVSTR